MEHVEVDGVTLVYAVAGAGEPVIFIHGALIADVFQPLVREPNLANRYRLISYRRRGYADGTHGSRPVSIARHAADCRAVLAHVGVGRAHIVGHSFGGAIALQLALDAPEVVHSLALIEPSLMIGESGGPYREALMRGGERYRAVETAIVVDEFLEARSPGYRPRLDAALPGAFAQAVHDAKIWFMFELPAQLDWGFGRDEARQIAQPTLSVVGGESARLWDRFGETHRWLLDSLPHAEAFVLAGATHLAQIEQPQRMAAGLAEFFGRHPISA